MLGFTCTDKNALSLTEAFVRRWEELAKEEVHGIQLEVYATPDVNIEGRDTVMVKWKHTAPLEVGDSFYGTERTRAMTLRLPVLDHLLNVLQRDTKLVYFDNDLLLLRSPRDLKMALRDFDKPLAAVSAFNPHAVFQKGFLEQPDVVYHRKHHEAYFNSGLLCFNVGKALDHLQGQSIVEKYESEWENYMFPDQDVLNLLFRHQDVHRLEYKFNYQGEHLAPEFLDDVRVDAIRKEAKHAAFYHMTGKVKPWYWSNMDTRNDAAFKQIDFNWLADELTRQKYPQEIIDGVRWNAHHQDGVEQPLRPSPYLTPFCQAPFTVYNHREEGYRPCCSRHATPHKPDKNWWSSDYLRKFRMAMFDAKTLPPECKKCASMSNRGPAQYAHGYDWKAYNPKNGEYTKSAREIILFVSDKCDMACEMCDSRHSTMHARTFPDRIIPIFDVTEDDNMSIITRHRDVELITFMGGEPFLDKKFYAQLKHALDNTNAFIAILSNGNRSYRKHKVYNELILPNRNRIHITLSVDGDEEDQKRIRLGVKPEQVMENLKHCLEDGVGVETHYTLSKLNIDRFVPHLEYLRSEGVLEHPRFQFNMSHVDFPEDYHPRFAPEEEKKVALQQVESFTDFYQWHITPKVGKEIIKSLKTIGEIINE